jgi:hypothetical protein
VTYGMPRPRLLLSKKQLGRLPREPPSYLPHFYFSTLLPGLYGM